MRIGVVGAGAIGGWVGVRLAQRGHQISVLARGETLRALRDENWRLDCAGATLRANVAAVSDDPDDLGPQDVLLISLKGPALEALAPRLASLIDDRTIILPMMNGVPWWFLLAGAGELPPTRLTSIDPVGAIGDALPHRQIIGTVVYASAATAAPGHIVHKAGNRLVFGEPDGSDSKRLRTICDLFIDAGFDVERSPSIRYEIWYKLWGNMTMNPISAITRATCDRLLDDELVSSFVLRVMAEAQAIGDRIGCRIKESGEARNLVTRQLGAFKTSMLQDAESGRPLEIDQLLLAPREIAGLLKMKTSDLDALLGLVRVFAQSHGLYPPRAR